MTRASSTQEVHDALIALEEEEGFWELEAYGVRYWHHIRHAVFNSALVSLGLMGRPQGTWRDRKLGDWLGDLPPSYFPPALERASWSDLGQSDILLINHPRHVRQGDHWVCPYTQPLLEAAPYSHWVVEDVHQGVHAHPQRDGRLKYLEWPFLFAQARFLARHGLTGGRLGRAEKNEVRRFSDALTRRLGGGPSNERALALTRAAVREISAFTELYDRLLDRVDPKLVVLVVGYSYRCLPMTKLARGRGIPVAELQHGTMGAAHLPYNLAPGRRPDSFPDYLLTFGDWWRETCPSLPLPKEAVPAIGYAWLEAHRERARKIDDGSRTRLLVISQGTVGDELSRWALELHDALEGRVDVRYKLHPGEIVSWRARYPALASAPFQVIDEPTNIYDEFLRTDAVVGVYSTAMYEALAFGLPLFVAELAGSSTIRPLCDSGAATLCSSPAELVEAVRFAEPPPEEIRNRIWRPDARNNFWRFVERFV